MPASVTAAPDRIHALLDPWVERSPGLPALRDAHGAYTYGELAEASAEAADQLRQWGVGAGDRVLVVGENCVAAAVLVLAASRLDAWICVANARLSPREIDGIIEHATPRRVFYTSEVSADALAHAARHGAEPLSRPCLGRLHLSPLNPEAVPEPCHASAQEQVAALIYTSGTSGTPKGVMLTHANMAFAARSATAVRGLGPGDLSYGVLPMAHVVGLSAQLLGCLASGAELMLEPRFSAAAMARAFEGGVTTFTGVPAMYSRLLDFLRQEQRSLAAPKLRLIAVAGSPLTPALKAQAEQVFGLPLLNGYGLTETSPTVAQVRGGSPRSDCSVGPPIPGVEARIVRQGAGEASAADVGELWVRGPNVMKGYYRNEALTREVTDAQGWFNTGDMARQTPDGALHIVGRTRELIIRSGFNVYPVEVEQAINSFPGVVQSAVVGRTAGDNEEVVAFVEAGDEPIDAGALRQHLRTQLSPYKQPAEIRFLDRLPAAPTGKILKARLRTLAAEDALPIGASGDGAPG